MFGKNRTVAIIRKLMPSVVSIVVTEKLADFEKTLTPELRAGLPKKKDGRTLAIPRELIDAHGMIQVGGGSGFVVRKDGIIVTNKHVVSDGAEYTVITNSGQKYQAEILTRDPLNDVAILRIPAKRLRPLALGNAARLELGEDVIAIGNALGIFKNTVSKGIVSGLSRSISAESEPNSGMQEMRGLIQTDAAINPGNSGGPLVNMRGEVVGINSAIVSGAHSIGFAIPINTVERDLADLTRYGRIRRPLLGLRYVIIDERLKQRANLPVDYGALVMDETALTPGVIPGSPAYEAGLANHDIVLTMNGGKITGEKTIQDFLEELEVGETVELQVLRKGKKMSFRVKLAERK